jgi:predicted phosphodiesterase
LRIAVLSDVHGNLSALEACLREVERLDVDRRVFLGDVVGYMPSERECLELLESSGFLCQQGNHEAMLLEPTRRGPEHDAVYQLSAARARLSEPLLARLAGWPSSRVVEAGNDRILFVHGTPTEPLDGYAYPDSDLSTWDGLPYAAVFTGNTHRPFAIRQGRILIANVGSVGLPRDVGNLACFAVYDGATGECVHYRVRFDVDRLLARLGDRIHQSVRDCLRRQADEFVGKLTA